MTKETLAAALNVAYAVAGVDGFANEEAAVLAKELQSFNLSDEAAQEIIEMYTKMPVLKALNIIAVADEDVRKEAHALVVYSCIADSASEKEIGAYTLVKHICNLPDITVDEAKQILGF